MDFQDFPMCLGKSGCRSWPPPLDVCRSKWARPSVYGAMPRLAVWPKRISPHCSAACGGFAELIYFGAVVQQLTLLQIEFCRSDMYE